MIFSSTSLHMVTRVMMSLPLMMPGGCRELDGEQQILTESWQDRVAFSAWSPRIWVFVMLNFGWGRTILCTPSLQNGASLVLHLLGVSRTVFAHLKFGTNYDISWIMTLHSVSQDLLISCLDSCNVLYMGLPLKYIRSFSWCIMWLNKQSLWPLGWPILPLCSANSSLLPSAVQDTGYDL